jgi:flagellar basal body rod protein FlgF
MNKINNTTRRTGEGGSMSCKCDKVLLSRKVAEEHMLEFCQGNFEAASIDLGVILDDRGYLRLVNTDDYQCLGHGENIKINFCPLCGRKF